MRTYFLRTCGGLTVAAALIVTALPLVVSAAQPNRGAGAHSRQVRNAMFVFGRMGGNIRPFTVTVGASGEVAVSGAIGASGSHVHLSPAALRGLLRLARAERFFTMPDQFQGANVLPDVATLFITVHTGTITKSVHMHGTNSNFEELFAVLTAATGVSF